MNSSRADEKYYQVVRAGSLTERLAVRARDRLYNEFIRCCEPTGTTTILDVGVSDVVNAAANVLERHYPYPHQITAVGLGDGREFHAAFPDIAYVRIQPNKPLPFADKQFDVATANAVLEHVGSQHNQRRFLSELTRVARQVFVTVPNRYFPVEHHTALPLVHFWGPSFRLACKWMGKDDWTREENLILLSRNDLSVLAGNNSAVVGFTGIKLGRFSSNLFLHLPPESCGV